MSNRVISRGKHSEISRSGVIERWSLVSVNNTELCMGEKGTNPSRQPDY
jgi:hypothetical protein